MQTKFSKHTYYQELGMFAITYSISYVVLHN